MKFIVEHGILSRGYYDTMQEARANLYDKKGRKGTIEVEMAEEEYTALTEQILALHDLQRTVNVLAEDYSRQLQELKGQYSNKFRQLNANYQGKLETMARRIEGLQNAVRKWRVRAKVDEPSERELISAERKYRSVKGKYVLLYIEHWTIPVEKNPCLAREAWAWLDEKEQTQYVERLYFHEKHQCWVAAIRTEW